MFNDMVVPEVQKKFASYPTDVCHELLVLRQLILDTAAQIDEVGVVLETLKWGEPSYISRIGSTVRIDWKKACPNQIYIFFNCKTKLVDTFREIYRNIFTFEGNRAIVLSRDEKLSTTALKHCITLSLRYKKIKDLPLLGT